MDTYRLSCVPISYTDETQIRDLFPEIDRRLIFGPISLATSVGSKLTPTKVATVSFSELPSFLLKYKKPRHGQGKKKHMLPSFVSNCKESRHGQGKNKHMEDPKTLSERFEFELPLSRLIQINDAQAEGIRIDNKMEGLTPFVDPPDDTAAVDIVACTGLAGRAFGSWQHPEGTMWLRDLLPRHVEGIRVLIWGQSSKMEGSWSHLSIQNLRDGLLEALKQMREGAKARTPRPIILIGHSLGGIVIKAAYVRAAQVQALTSLYESIQALVFFATPHDGMQTGPWIKLWGDKPPQTIIRDLTPGSSLLKELKEAFQRTRMDVDILSCFEREETPTARQTETGKISRDGEPVLYVPESSACTGHTNEQPLSINANHSQIAKLSDGYGGAYDTVEPYINTMVVNARKVVGNRFRIKHAVQVLTSIQKFLEHTLTESPNIEVLFFAEINQLAAVATMILNAEGTLLDPVAERLNIEDVFVAVSDLERLFHDDILSAKQKSPALHAALSTGAEIEWPESNAVLKHDTTCDALDLQDLTKQAIPVILDLRATLATLVPSSTIGILEKFILSPAADHLGLDFVVQRQNLLDSPPPDCLPPVSEKDLEVKSSVGSLTLGTYSSNGSPSKDVVLEFRSYGSNLAVQSRSPEEISSLQESVQELASHLSIAAFDASKADTAERSMEPSVAALQCVGWFHEPEKQRFVFVNSIPRPFRPNFADVRSHISTLDNWIDCGRKNEVRLDEQFSIAYQLSRTVFNLLVTGWVHKSINPSNCILLPCPVSCCGILSDLSRKRHLIPYLKGFQFSRKAEAYSDLSPANDKENNIYRHPNRQREPNVNEKFGPIHDIYALGTVLLELGRCKRIGAEDPFKKNSGLLGPERTRTELVHIARTRLPIGVGIRYADCVERCLQGNFDIDDDDVDGGGVRLVFAFRRLVVDELKRMAAACGSYM